MTKEPNSHPLIIDLIKYSRLPRYWAILIAGIIMVLGLALAAYLDSDITDLLELGFWRNFMDAPVLITYILMVYPFVWRLWRQSIQSLQSLLPTEEGNSNDSAMQTPMPNRRREWVAIFIGAILWLILWQPWGWDGSWEPGAIWQSAYEVITQTTLFGLIAVLIYSSFTDNWYLNRFIRQHLEPDIFNTRMLTPIALSSLGLSIAWIGGISLSLVFQTQEDLLSWKNIVVWAVVICFAVLVFFLSLWNTHRTITKVKRRELDFIQEYLKTASHELKGLAKKGNVTGTEELSLTISAWLSYERRIKEVSEWPYDAGIIRRLVASTIVPAVVYLLKIISGLGLRF